MPIEFQNLYIVYKFIYNFLKWLRSIFFDNPNKISVSLTQSLGTTVLYYAMSLYALLCYRPLLCVAALGYAMLLCSAMFRCVVLFCYVQLCCVFTACLLLFCILFCFCNVCYASHHVILYLWSTVIFTAHFVLLSWSVLCYMFQPVSFVMI